MTILAETVPFRMFSYETISCGTVSMETIFSRRNVAPRSTARSTSRASKTWRGMT